MKVNITSLELKGPMIFFARSGAYSEAMKKTDLDCQEIKNPTSMPGSFPIGKTL